MLPPPPVQRNIFIIDTSHHTNWNLTDFYPLQKTPFEDKDKTQIWLGNSSFIFPFGNASLRSYCVAGTWYNKISSFLLKLCPHRGQGALCNRHSNPGFPVIQEGKQHLLGLPLSFCIICPYLPHQPKCPELVFFFWKKIWVYGQGRMQSCSISFLSSEKWRIRASGCTGTAMCLSVYPSGAIPGICTISETFLFPVCGVVRIHSAFILNLQYKVNNF